ncbi:MAG TPA: sugar-binding domain-containing protein [Acidimicrobiales bacterium]|nr:sugar-binding domain-containing protein [Acidimicrobiales bacterium]
MVRDGEGIEGRVSDQKGKEPRLEASDLVARVARLHFEFGLTHQETADSLGLSRVKVTRMVKQARQSGLVKITIASDASPYAELEQEMMERFGLTEVIIVPSPSADAGNMRSLLALGTVSYITRILRDEMTVAVGLSRTIGEAARLAAAGAQMRRSTAFVSLVGSLREGGVGGDSPFGASAILAQAFGGSVEHLHAPIIVRSGAVALELMRDPAIAQSLERAAKADVLLAGVGGRVDRIDLSGQGYLEPHEWEELGAAGMVGDMCARFFDKDGQAVQHDVTSRVIGLTLEQLLKIPTRLVVAGGASKRAAVRATLRGHLATVLVTDYKTAEDLLKKD